MALTQEKKHQSWPTGFWCGGFSLVSLDIDYFKRPERSHVALSAKNGNLQAHAKCV